MTATNSNWTYYDQVSAGALNWVLVSNLNNYQIFAEIRIGGALVGEYDIGMNQNAVPAFPGVKNGPVEVKAWTDSSRTTPAPVFASQRVLWNGYFNEIVGKGV
jgi:hypothetical protein